MPYSISTKDGITIQNIPDNVPQDAQELKDRVSQLRAGQTEAPVSQTSVAQPEQGFFQKNLNRAGQFASGAVESVAGVPFILNDLVRAGGQAVGVPSQYLPYGSQKVAESLQDVGVTQRDTGEFPISRFAGGVTGAFMTPVPLPKTTTLPRIQTSPSEASKKLFQAFKRDKAPTTELYKRLTDLGPEATIADIGGENVKALARASASLPGPAKEMAARVLNERQFGQSARVSGQVSESLGSGELFYKNIDDLLEARKAISTPLYEKAVSASNRIPSKAFQPIARDDFIVGIIDKIKSDPLYKMGGLPNNSMPIIDATKKYIDRLIYSAKRGTNPNNYDISRLVEKSKKLRDIADNQFPVYARARDSFAGPTQLVDALENGRAFLRGDAEMTKATLAKLPKSEQEFFRIGAARALRDKVLNTPDTADTVKKIFNTPLMREKLQVVFPNANEFKAFEKMMNNEATLFQTRSAVLSGSRTAPLQAEMADTVSDTIGTGKILYDLAKGNIGTAVMGMGRKLSGPKTLKPEVSEELASMLFTKGVPNREILNAILTKKPSGQAKIPSYLTRILDNPLAQRALLGTGVTSYQQGLLN